MTITSDKVEQLKLKSERKVAGFWYLNFHSILLTLNFSYCCVSTSSRECKQQIQNRSPLSSNEIQTTQSQHKINEKLLRKCWMKFQSCTKRRHWKHNGETVAEQKSGASVGGTKNSKNELANVINRDVRWRRSWTGLSSYAGELKSLNDLLIFKS